MNVEEARVVKVGPRTATWPFFAVAAVVTACVAFLKTAQYMALAAREFGGGSSADQTIQAISFAAGNAMVPALLIGGVVTLVLHFAFVRNRNPDKSYKYFGILVATALAGWLAAILLSAPSFYSAQLQASLVNFERRAGTESKQNAEAYRANLEATHWDAVLDPRAANFTTDTEVALARIEQARMVEAEFGALIDKRGREARIELEAALRDAGASPSEIASTLTSYDRGFASGQGSWKASQRIHAQVYDETTAVVGLLAKLRGTWVVRRGQYIFNRPEALAAFQSRMANLRDLGAAEQALLAAASATPKSTTR